MVCLMLQWDLIMEPKIVSLFNQLSTAVINAQLVFIETVGLLQYLMRMGQSFIE